MNAQLAHYADKLAYEIDSWDLSVALRDGANVVVVDARGPDAFAREHIPGAINLPHSKMDAATTAAIDRTALVAVYCDGIGCNASTKGALAMSRLGFAVRELIGGLDWWMRDGHPTNGATVQAAAAPCGCNQAKEESP